MLGWVEWVELPWNPSGKPCHPAACDFSTSKRPWLSHHLFRCVPWCTLSNNSKSRFLRYVKRVFLCVSVTGVVMSYVLLSSFGYWVRCFENRGSVLKHTSGWLSGWWLFILGDVRIFFFVCKCVNVQSLFSPGWCVEASGHEDTHFIALN